MIESEIDGDLAAMRAADNRRVAELQMTHERREIIRGKVSFRSRGRPAVPSAVVSNGMKVLAEFRPDLIPRSRVQHAIMHQHHTLGTAAAFFVIELGAVHLEKGT